MKLYPKKELLEKLNELYRQIPSFGCLKGCTDCCGPIFFSGLEASLIKTQKVPRDTKCPYAGKGCCTIYEVRPMICRLFGAVNDPKLTCSFGCGPALRLDKDHAKWLLTEVLKVSERAGYGGVIETHRALFNSMLSPGKIKIHLPEYDFKE